MKFVGFVFQVKATPPPVSEFGVFRGRSGTSTGLFDPKGKLIDAESFGDVASDLEKDLETFRPTEIQRRGCPFNENGNSPSCQALP